MTDSSKSTATKIAQSFKYAFTGVAYVFRTQRNARIHAIISLGVAALGLWLRISGAEAMMVVWVAEFINTAIEALVDLTMPDEHTRAMVAKDVAAAAVLIGAIGAVIVGLLILGPPLTEKIF
jgi:diacylglycerol kinase